MYQCLLKLNILPNPFSFYQYERHLLKEIRKEECRVFTDLDVCNELETSSFANFVIVVISDKVSIEKSHQTLVCITFQKVLMYPNSQKSNNF